MKKAVIFGASSTGQRIYEDIKEQVEVIAFLDECPEKKRGGGQAMMAYISIIHKT